jgi:hypothetical protein
LTESTELPLPWREFGKFTDRERQPFDSDPERGEERDERPGWLVQLKSRSKKTKLARKRAIRICKIPEILTLILVIAFVEYFTMPLQAPSPARHPAMVVVEDELGQELAKAIRSGFQFALTRYSATPCPTSDPILYRAGVSCIKENILPLAPAQLSSVKPVR